MMTPRFMTFDRMAPVLFVLLWSTGWIAPVYAGPHASAEMFLTVRFALAALAFLTLSLAVGAPFPRDRMSILHPVVSGFFLHGVYLGGVWWAIFHGVPASLSGVIAALQPLMTAAVAALFLAEKLTFLQRVGLVIGFLGIVLALAPNFVDLTPELFATKGFPILVNVVSMMGAVIGTLYQKRYVVGGDLRSTAVLQFLGALCVVVPLMVLLGDYRFDMSMPLLLTLGWSVFGLSMGAIALLLTLIRRGQVSRAASLNYLMPPTVAIQAYLLFGDHLTWQMIVGTIIAVTGVYLINRKVV
jgi:drug/metabolite transporter (DMT)-like permease